MRSSPSFRTAHAFARLWVIAVLAAIAAACSSGDTDIAEAGANEPAPVAVLEPVASQAAETLEAKAQQAVAENRLYAPEGDNAIEFYLAQREQADSGARAADAALVELQPYAMMAAEQAIAGEEFAEAERLVALMVRIDPTAPSLSRLRDNLEAGRKAQAAALAAAEAAEAAESAEAEAAATRAPPPATSPAPAPRPSAEPPSRAPATAVRTASPAPARPANPAPTAAAPAQRPAATPATPARSAPATGPLVPVNTPFPPFPSEAIARGRSMGRVTARFTVRANGRVTDVRIIEARPEGLFERTVLETLAEWRFEPSGADQTQTRTFDFRN